MQLPTEKIELFGSKEVSRHVLSGVLFDVENKRLVATNGHMLAVLPCEPEPGDTTGLIPKRAFDLARELVSRLVSVSLKKRKKRVLIKNLVTNELTAINAGHGQFPKYEALLKRDYNGRPTIAINLDFLRDVFEGIRTNADKDPFVYIWCDPNDRNKPALVSTAYSKAVAILMQVRTDRTAESVYADVVPVTAKVEEKEAVSA